SGRRLALKSKRLTRCYNSTCYHWHPERVFCRKTGGLTASIPLAMPRDESIMTRSRTGAGPIDWPAELERHGRWLRTVALARVGDAAAADDVLQEVAVAAVAKGHQLRDPKSV